jgi:hypothetical protein
MADGRWSMVDTRGSRGPSIAQPFAATVPDNNLASMYAVSDVYEPAKPAQKTRGAHGGLEELQGSGWVALGSSAELGTQVEVARRLRYVSAEKTRDLDEQLERVRQMLYGMRREHLGRLATAGVTVGSVFLLLRAVGVVA